MRMAASSPVWLTRRAEVRKARCWALRGRMGLDVWVEAAEESSGEDGGMGCLAVGGGGGGGGGCEVL